MRKFIIKKIIEDSKPYIKGNNSVYDDILVKFAKNINSDMDSEDAYDKATEEVYKNPDDAIELLEKYSYTIPINIIQDVLDEISVKLYEDLKEDVNEVDVSDSKQKDVFINDPKK